MGSCSNIDMQFGVYCVFKYHVQIISWRSRLRKLSRARAVWRDRRSRTKQPHRVLIFTWQISPDRRLSQTSTIPLASLTGQNYRPLGLAYIEQKNPTNPSSPHRQREQHDNNVFSRSCRTYALSRFEGVERSMVNYRRGIILDFWALNIVQKHSSRTFGTAHVCRNGVKGSASQTMQSCPEQHIVVITRIIIIKLEAARRIRLLAASAESAKVSVPCPA